MNQKGQVILVLILIMTVALAIGLSIVQRSLVDITTASKVEQSSRAFSAAEAGIERLLQTGVLTGFDLPNDSKVTSLTDSGLLPITIAAGANLQQLPLEIASPASPLAKEEVAQVWLANFNSTTPSSPPNCGPNMQCFYTQNALDIYWGNSASDQAALVLTLIYWDGPTSSYTSKKWYLDHSSASRNPSNGFDTTLCSGNYSEMPGYRCYVRIGDPSLDPAFSKPGYGVLPTGLILLRARLLYNVSSQPFAVRAVNTCGPACSLPPQLRIYSATGESGQTQRKVQIQQQLKVVPPFFDYAVFSAGDISK